MDAKFLGSRLKKARIDAGITVKEISESLVSNGFRASTNTIYSWENGNSQPTPDALLFMCSKYQICDVLSFFGYSEAASETKKSREVSDHEYQMILAYRSQPAMQPAVDRILGLKSEDDSTEALKERIKRSGFTVPKDFDKIVERANAMSELLNQKSPAKK